MSIIKTPANLWVVLFTILWAISSAYLGWQYVQQEEWYAATASGLLLIGSLGMWVLPRFARILLLIYFAVAVLGVAVRMVDNFEPILIGRLIVNLLFFYMIWEAKPETTR